ncbi:MAG: aminotransferase class I/II-fold pyridoxal phosphate-dependent enzyme [Methylococcales bacterium]
MLDFTSALYLGMRHPACSLPPWQSLTTGYPAALAEPPGATDVAKAFARLQGCEQGVLMSSTLHLYWDLFGMLSKQPVAIYLDEHAYTVSRWGAKHAAAYGVPVCQFRHHSAAALLAQIRGQADSKRRPVVVIDGYCPACVEFAPLADYLKIIRPHNGLLVIDDTQALGILGALPESNAPYGREGGGILPWSGQGGSDILVGSSLAKAFGVPIAVLAGSGAMIGHFIANSDTRVHCSPPSIAVINAAAQALAINQLQGNRLRQQLADRIRQFRNGLAGIGLSVTGGWFPVQSLRNVVGRSAVRLHHQLFKLGIQTVLTRTHNGSKPRLNFLITARHSPKDIDRCIDILAVVTNYANTSAKPEQLPAIQYF